MVPLGHVGFLRTFLERAGGHHKSKKSPTGPTFHGPPKPQYLIARSQLTERGPLVRSKHQFLMEQRVVIIKELIYMEVMLAKLTNPSETSNIFSSYVIIHKCTHLKPIHSGYLENGPPEWRCISYTENGDIPARYVCLPEGKIPWNIFVSAIICICHIYLALFRFHWYPWLAKGPANRKSQLYTKVSPL